MPLAWPLACHGANDWGYVSEPEIHAEGRSVLARRGKILGGSSSVNGLLYSRGYAQDYDRWASLGLPGWDFNELLPYFRKMEASWRGAGHYHGASGPLSVERGTAPRPLHDAILATAENLGFPRVDDFHGHHDEGYGVPDFTIARGRRASAASCYLRPAIARTNLAVLTRALTHRVLVNSGKATGVQFEHRGRVHTVHADREVLLCAGAFNSPQLLMLSGIGPADDLRAHGIEVIHHLPGVGRNLQDHHAFNLTYSLDGRAALEGALRLDRVLMSLARWKLFGDGLAATVPVSAQGLYRSSSTVDWPNAQTVITPLGLASRVWFPVLRKGLGPVLVATNVLLRPKSSGDVRLLSADPGRAPRIRFNLLRAQADVAAFRDMFRFAVSFFSAHPIADLVRERLDPPAELHGDAITAFLRSRVHAAMHPAGTCAMGQGEWAVLDATCRVRGISSLRIVDASAMPHVVSGNPHAPVIAMAEKAADMIKGLSAPLEAQHRTMHTDHGR